MQGERPEINPELLQFGGQAIIEGVMMRGRRFFAVACRHPNGSVSVQVEPIEKGILAKLRWLRLPLLRGSLALIDSMALGSRALAFSSNIQLEEINGKTEEPQEGKQKIGRIAIGGTMVTAMLFALFVFKLLPTLLTGLVQKAHLVGPHPNGHLLNALDGLIRIVFFFSYILLISRMDQVKRLFMYHGAEHKAINTLEAGLPLTAQNALASSRIHPRCGTSFIFVVLMLDLIVTAFLPRPASLLVRFALQAAVVPVVAGISYEIMRFSARFRSARIVQLIFGPGMATQYLTTREPDASQVEVALASLRAVLLAEGHEDLGRVPEEMIV